MQSAADKMPGAARKAGEMVGAAGRGVGAAAGKARDAIANRQKNTPLRGAKTGTQVGTPQQQALADVQSGGPKTPTPQATAKPAAAAAPTGRMDPKAVGADKAKRAQQSADANTKLKGRLAAVKGEQAGSKQSFKTSLGRAKTTGRLGGRLQQDLSHTAYKQIGRMLAEALGWTL